MGAGETEEANEMVDLGLDSEAVDKNEEEAAIVAIR